MRCFKNIATLIRNKRMNHPKEYSQSELSHLLGYKNGQFISNVERALCNIPLKMLLKVSDVLDIHPDEIKAAILKDQEETLNNYLRAASKEEMPVASTTGTRSAKEQSASNESPFKTEASVPAQGYKLTGTQN